MTLQQQAAAVYKWGSRYPNVFPHFIVTGLNEIIFGVVVGPLAFSRNDVSEHRLNDIFGQITILGFSCQEIC